MTDEESDHMYSPRDKAVIGARRRAFVSWGLAKENYGAALDPLWYERTEHGVLRPVRLEKKITSTSAKRHGN